MKRIAFTLSVLFAGNVFAQSDKLTELIAKGVELHDQQKYDEAISQFKAALEIDSKSSLANYEISYSYLLSKQYESAIKHSTIVVDNGTEYLHEAYIVLGSAQDMTGKPLKAIKTYEEGLKKFPNSHLLHYNLAFTCYYQKDYKKAEASAIAAIIAKPEHGSSHILLSAIMDQVGQRVKSLLPMYYFLMIEPGSERSLSNYNWLKSQLGMGVEKKDEKNINVNIPISSSDDDFSAAEMMASLLAASKHTDENKKKSEMEMFVETNDGLFGVLGELRDKKNGFWWDFYVTKFYDMKISKHNEAFSYYISQCTGSEDVKKWMASNSEKINQFINWMKQ